MYLHRHQVKQLLKYRLQTKLEWILLKYYPIQKNTDVPKIRAEDGVTVLDIDNTDPISLTDDERRLLSLGPTFAITPKINDDLLHKVQVDIAQCAYKLKWRHYFDGISSRNSDLAEQQETTPDQTNIPFKSPFVSAPPRADNLLEAELSLFNNFFWIV